MINKPGKYGKPFILVLNYDCFKKNDVITDSSGTVKVIKVYKRTWIRLFLNWLGIKVRMKGIKCKPIN